LLNVSGVVENLSGVVGDVDWAMMRAPDDQARRPA